MSSNIITSDTYRLHININDLEADSSGNIFQIYYIFNNGSNDSIHCSIDSFLSTTILGKTVQIKLEQLDNDIVKITENLNISSSSAYNQKTFILYTQITKITFTFDSIFDGHIYGNIKKTSSSYISNTINGTSLNVEFDKTSYDAFGRMRISNPITLFDSQNRYSKNDKFTEYTIGGTTTFNLSDSSVNLTTSDTSGSMVIRETKNVFSYQPGKSLLILNTFAFNDQSGNNLIQRVGYYTNYNTNTYVAPYNPKNGIYLEASGNVINICKANNNTITKISQSNWNNYKFLGESPYFITLDLTKAQIFWLDIEWLGVGSVRTGFIINGKFILAHTFHHANIETTTYMQTACLPIRYEIIKNSTSGTGGTLKQICSTVISEGGYESSSQILHVGTGNSQKNITSGNSKLFNPLISIRLKTDKFDSIVIPSQLSIVAGSSDVLIYRVLLNATLASPVWVSAGSNSNIEFDLSGTYIADTGTEINSGYITQNGVVNLSSSKDFNLQLGKNFNGTSIDYTSDIITLVVSKVGTSSAYDVAGMIGWYDIIK
jgi:hypothetical protein